jgi:hypothetical protein
MSAMYGVIGKATIDPTDMIAFKRPLVAGLGWLKASMISLKFGDNKALALYSQFFHSSRAWRPFIIDPS